MERAYYNVESLARIVSWYEQRYGVSTAELLKRHRAGDGVESLSSFERHVWLSFARELEDARAKEDVSHRFRRELVVA